MLEIGPGLGILTRVLLDAGAEVTAVEVDARLADHLRSRFAGLASAGAASAGAGAFHLVQDDALDVPVDELIEAPWKLVANLPYHITSPVLHHVLDSEPRPGRFVLMLQRQVAERIAAPAGQMSYLSIFVQYHAEVRVARVVPASAFEPAPAVDSAILVGVTRPRALSTDAEASLWRVVQSGFRERRKMLHNVLARQLSDVGAERVQVALSATGIEGARRPQTLSVAEWISLAAALRLS